MGVPSFFRWLVAKYPRVIKDAVVPTDEEISGTGDGVMPLDLSAPNPNGEYDNLYLDMNGLIHPACHPEDKPQPETEDDMIENVFMYIDRIFAIVRPRKLLYMAIDGVAPRAKMNQQRMRRFKTAKEIEEASKTEEELRHMWKSEGKDAPEPKKRWDHNAITPGTAFMDRLSKALQFYVNLRITRDPAWASIKVIFSDASVPGEGEHKLMNYIRLQRAQPGYDPNMSHVFYGMDADLIMLGLATHEVNFNIIRETVVFKNQGGGPRCHVCQQVGHIARDCRTGPLPESAQPVAEDDLKNLPDAPFQFVQIAVLREYLLTELFVEGTSFKWDGERSIDDFVFLCFFVGNDFLPHLPSLEIREGAIDDLIILYKRMIRKWDGYLTDHGDVDLGKANELLKDLSSLEDRIFKLRKESEDRNEQRKEHQAKMRAGVEKEKEMVARQAQREKEAEDTSSFSLAQNQDAMKKLKRKLSSQKKEAPAGDRNKRVKLSGLSDDDSADEFNRKVETKVDDAVETPVIAADDEEDLSLPIPPAAADQDVKSFFAEVKSQIKKKNTVENVEDDVKLDSEGWKERYYLKKFGISSEHISQRHGPVFDIAKSYIEGLCWVLLYYYRGCPSWGWYYPYHYAPFASDLFNAGVVTVEFEIGRPFSPLAQLMGVLPSLSGHLVPEPYRRLMCEKNSPVIDFYPINFAQDLNGKKMMWQAVALLPFIDESRLLEALHSVRHLLTEEEFKRDCTGVDFVYVGMTNTLANEITSLYLKYQNVDPSKLLKKRKLISPAESGGIFGFLAPHPDAEHPGSTLRCVLPRVQPLVNSRSICAAFFDPPYRKHLCTILDNAKVPDPILSQQDFLTVSSSRRFGGRSILRMDSFYNNNNGPGTTQYVDGYFKKKNDDTESLVGQADLRRRGSYDQQHRGGGRNHGNYRDRERDQRRDDRNDRNERSDRNYRGNNGNYSGGRDDWRQGGYVQASYGNAYSGSYAGGYGHAQAAPAPASSYSYEPQGTYSHQPQAAYAYNQGYSQQQQYPPLQGQPNPSYYNYAPRQDQQFSQHGDQSKRTNNQGYK